MGEISRKKLRIRKTVKNVTGNRNSIKDIAEVKLAFAMSEHRRFKMKNEILLLEEKDAELERITTIPEDSSELIVITKTKKLGAYIVAITAKSPAKFRGTFVNRMQNLLLDCLQNLLKANFIKLNSDANTRQRKNLQQEAVINLKMVGYIALLAENAGCILQKQYKQISIMVGECINLTVAWMKSDDKRLNNK